MDLSFVSADEPWLPPIILSPDQCDTTPDCSEPSDHLPLQPATIPILGTPSSVHILSAPPLEVSTDTQGTTALDQRLNHLAELFDDLHQRLDRPVVPESVDVSLDDESEPQPQPEPDSPPTLTTSTDELTETQLFTLPEQMSAGVVDRRELADNLFAAGETRLALDVYAAIDLNHETTTDRFWIMFQTAACYRRLGDSAEATQRYRELVTVAEPAWVGDLSRWWLNTIETRHGLIDQTNQLTTTIEHLQEAIHADIGK